MAFPKKMRYGFNLALIICCILLIAPLQAQDLTIPSHAWKEAGLPYIQNFSPQDYNGEIQNFSPVQDSRGLIYFGNQKGVLIYDGVSWRLIPTPKKTLVRSLLALDDRIYVGSYGEFGYLSPDAVGELHYVSLLDKVPEDDRHFADVHDILVFQDAVYFMARNTLFQWSENDVRVWKSTQIFAGGIVFKESFYIAMSNTGLMRMAKDSLHFVGGSEIFADKNIRAMFPIADSLLLIATFSHGLFTYDGHEFRPFPTSIDDFLYRHQLRDGAKLAGGLFALATNRGVVLIDQSGNLRQVVNKASGLRDELVIRLFPDRQGGLWLGLNNGIARIETPAPLSRFQDATGFESFVESITRHNGRLYAAHDRGVSYLNENKLSLPHFKSVTGVSTLSWTFVSVGKRLLLGTQDGIFEISAKSAIRINTLKARCFHRSRQDSNRIFVGLVNGLAEIRLQNGQWLPPQRVPGIRERVKAITEDENGLLWIGTMSDGVLRVAPEQKPSDTQSGQINARVNRYDKAHALPEGQIGVVAVADRILFTTLKGVRRFDGHQELFVPDSTFGNVFADTSCSITYIREDEERNVWFIASMARKVLCGKAVPQTDGSYDWQETPFLRMNDLGNIYLSYPEPNGVVWFGGSEGIARYTPEIPKDYTIDYPVLIRRVSEISTDSVFYYGAAVTQLPQPKIKYKNNSLRFEFAALSFDNPSANRYQVRLEGFDNEWSHWSAESKKDYTGLPAGNYTFRVRGKNIYGHLSREGTFLFTIRSPWYQTWWAFIFYTLLAAAGVFAIVKSRVRRFEKKTRELESIVAQRTGVIREQAEKLQELDKMKSRFFANISHEFRTPLTLILGPLEDRIARARKRADKDEFGMMHRSANRLLRLINELLDLSRLESGKMKLTASRGDFSAFLQGIVLSFAPLAKQKKITLQFEPCEGLKPSQGFSEVYFDGDKIEKIFMNLLSNAFKFTQEEGNVTVSVSVHNSLLNPPAKAALKESHLEEPVLSFSAEDVQHKGTGNVIQITIQDTGVGIPADRLPHIFDRFYQVDATSTREREGTGIGLALVKELVELHHGEIGVESSGGEGTTFKVTLPLGRAHLSEEEMAPSAPQHQTASLYHQPYVESEANTSPSPDFDEDATVVLVVDDHPDVRRYIRGHLKSDYRIVEADNGREGVRVALEAIPDLVISDVMMPKLDGYELCETLKTDEKTSHIPVILLTARAGEEDKLTGLDTGADDYLVKPFNAKELQARVRNLIEQRRKLRQRFVREGMLKPREIDAQSLDDLFLQKLMSNIEERMADENFSVEELSQKMNMGPRHLHRKVRAMTNKSPVELIRLVRLQRARQLLEQNAGTVSEIAYQVGFSNLSYFARMFKQEFSKLPSEW